MACTEILPAAGLIVRIGGILLTVGILIFAYSRPTIIEKISILGFEIKFREPITHPGYPLAKFLAIVLLILGALIFVAGVIKAHRPSEWPKALSDVCSAEVQLSRVDDLMTVSVNDQVVGKATYGETPDWIDIMSLLRKGPNKIETIIQNGRFGGCSGSLVVRLNGLENADYKWTWQTVENQLPDVVCFADTRTLNLQ